MEKGKGKAQSSKAKMSKSLRAGLTFPVSRFQRNLKKGNFADHIGTAGAIYMAGVLEYLTAEILELAGVQCREHDRVRIVPRHLMMAIKRDAELNDLLRDAFFSGSGVMPNINPLLIKKNSKASQNNEEMSEAAADETGDDEFDATSQNF